LCCDADAVHEVSVERCGLVLGFSHVTAAQATEKTRREFCGSFALETHLSVVARSLASWISH
jgi:hypothetical protein